MTSKADAYLRGELYKLGARPMLTVAMPIVEEYRRLLTMEINQAGEAAAWDRYAAARMSSDSRVTADIAAVDADELLAARRTRFPIPESGKE